MFMDEYLLIALAVIYFMTANGNPGREHSAARQNDQDNRSSIDAGRTNRDAPRRD